MQMRKSDYLKRAKELTGVIWPGDGGLVRLAEEFGAEWEPELPERVAQKSGVFLVPEGGSSYLDGFDEKIYAEAARRYNAYPELESLAQELAEELRQVNEGRFGTRCWSDLIARARSLGLLREAA